MPIRKEDYTQVFIGDPLGMCLERGWHYCGAINSIFIVGHGTEEDRENIENDLDGTIEILNHEILHSVIDKLFHPVEADQINYDLDYCLFALRDNGRWKKYGSDLLEK